MALTSSIWVMAVLKANAVPVFVDIDPETFNLEPAGLAAALSPVFLATLLFAVAALAAGLFIPASPRRRE